jgi:hypothetical protein
MGSVGDSSVDVGAAGSDIKLVAPSSSVVTADNTAGVGDDDDDDDAGDDDGDDEDDVAERGDSDCNCAHTSARMSSTACTSPR